jgi:hypothetical protein
MLHIRVVTTPGLTGRLLDRLADLPGIRNLIVLEGAARPSGDAVFFDVDHGAANPVFRALRGLSLDHDGAITVEQVDASLTGTAGAAFAIGSPGREIARCGKWSKPPSAAERCTPRASSSCWPSPG